MVRLWRAKYVDAPASTKSSGMCQTEMNPSTALTAMERWSAFTYQGSSALKTLRVWKGKSSRTARTLSQSM